MFVFLYFWVAILFCCPSDTLKPPYGIGSLFTHKAVHFPLSQAFICPKETRDKTRGKSSCALARGQGRELEAGAIREPPFRESIDTDLNLKYS